MTLSLTFLLISSALPPVGPAVEPAPAAVPGLAVASAVAPAVEAVVGLPAPAAPAPEEDVRAAFLRLFEAADDDGLRALWADHVGAILVTIDADLEGSLATWEAAPDAPDDEAIAVMHARALWGARLADEVTGRAIFHDYTASFVGWNDEQKRAFREGQAAFGAARQALDKGDAEAALAAARKCSGLALPLGDWWGAAMGLSLEGSVLAQQGELDDAIVAASRARMIYRQLGLAGSEYGCARTLLGALVQNSATQRALACAKQAIQLADALGDADGATALRSQAETLAAQLAG